MTNKEGFNKTTLKQNTSKVFDTMDHHRFKIALIGLFGAALVSACPRSSAIFTLGIITFVTCGLISAGTLWRQTKKESKPSKNSKKQILK